MKTYSYLRDNSREDKKCVIKRKLEFENFKNCLEAIQLENKKNHLKKNKIDIDTSISYKRKHKEFIKKQKINIKNTTKI